MSSFDSRNGCASCGRKDLRLKDCILCRDRICEFCYELHVQWDHKKDQKRTRYKEDE